MPQPEPTLGKIIVRVGPVPTYVQADASGSVLVQAVGAVVYYGTSKSVTAITGTDLQPGSSVTLTDGRWFVSSVETRVVVQDAQSTRVGSGGSTDTGGSTTPVADLLADPRTQDFTFTSSDDGVTIPINGQGEVRGTLPENLAGGWRATIVVQGAGFRLVPDGTAQVKPLRSLVFQTGDSFDILKRETTDGTNVFDLLDLPSTGAALVAGVNTFTNTNTFSSVVDVSATSGTLKLFGKTVYWGTDTDIADVAAAYPNAAEGSWFVTVPTDGSAPYILGEMRTSTVVSPPSAPTNTVVPLLEGSLARGNGLNVYQGTWTDTDTLTWQWQRETGVGTGVFANIAGASGSTAYNVGAALTSYITVAADDGLKVRCQVTATGDGGTLTVSGQTSGGATYVTITAPTDPVDVEKAHAGTATASTTKGARPEISETYEAALAIDGSLTTRWSSFFNSQSTPAVPGANGEWLRIDFGSPKLVKRVEVNWHTSYATEYLVQTSSDATTWTQQADVFITAPGIKVTSFTEVTARYVRILGVTRVATQYGISIVDLLAYGSDDGTGSNDVAFNVVRPAITGTAQVGQTLTCDDGVWQYPNGQTETVGPFNRQWTATTGSTTTDIAGATAKTWLTTSAYVGYTIGCNVTLGTLTAAGTPAVVLQGTNPNPDVAPAVAVLPDLPASALVGQSVSVNPGQYTGNPTPTVTRQWQQFTASAWANISGQTAVSYTPASTNQLRVVETATNRAGSITGTSDTVTPTPNAGGTRTAFAWPFAGSYPSSPFSPWNTPFTDQSTFEGSTGKTSVFLSGGTNVNSNNGYGMRLDQARSTDATISIYDGYNNDAFLVTIKAPSAAVPLSGSDGNLNIVEPNGLYVDTFWRMVQISSGKYRTFRWVRNYIRDNAAGQRYDGIGGGIRAAGFSTAAGIFRYHHIQDGECPTVCVLGIGRAMATAFAPYFIWPANSYDGYAYQNTSGFGLQLGDRFGIPWGTSQPAGLGPAGVVAFNQARTLGYYIGDTGSALGSNGVVLQAEPAVEANLGATAFAKFQADFKTIRALCRRLTNGSQTAPGGTLGTPRRADAPPFA